MQQQAEERIRLDKWLWAARFCKTRAIARAAIEGGKVHYNGQRTRPGKVVELNAELTLRISNSERTVIICSIQSQRRPASEAQHLYKETAESIKKREKLALERKLNASAASHPGRPDKKGRRDLLKLKLSGHE